MQKQQCVAKQCILPDSVLHMPLLMQKHSGPLREYFAHFRYQPSHFVHTLFINAYCQSSSKFDSLRSKPVKINRFTYHSCRQHSKFELKCAVIFFPEWFSTWIAMSDSCHWIPLRVAERWSCMFHSLRIKNDDFNLKSVCDWLKNSRGNLMGSSRRKQKTSKNIQSKD